MNVFIIAAVTVDGFIAKDKSQSSIEWTSSEDKKFFRERTKKAGVVVMGRTTYETIGRPLSDRLNVVYTKRPEKLKAVKNLRTTQKNPRELINQLSKEGFSEVAVIGGASIYTMFLKTGAVNKLYLTIEPVILGKGISLFDKLLKVKLKLVQVKNLSSQTLLLEYKIIKSS